jgi:hypothetical protein
MRWASKVVIILSGACVAAFIVVAAIYVALVLSVRYESTRLQNAADQESRWMREHIAVGMPRKRAYAILRAHGLVAYNWDFTKGKPTPGGGCDFTDRSTSAWPFQGETMPRGCAYGILPQRNPDATVDLPSGSNIACGFTTYITMRFTPGDRVRSVTAKRERVCL